MLKRVIVILFATIIGSPAAHTDYLQCRHTIMPTLNDLYQRKTQLFRQLPNLGSGPQVSIGTCASRFAKLLGGETTTFTNMAAISEQISCLDLKKYYLEKSCECGDRNATFTTDEVTQDQVFEMYAAAKKLRDTATKKGIKNPIIQTYIKSLNEAIACIDTNTIAIIKKSMDDFEKTISLEQ